MVLLLGVFFVPTETQKRERKRRARAAQEARAAAKEARAEELRASRIAAMRAFTVDLQVGVTCTSMSGGAHAVKRGLLGRVFSNASQVPGCVIPHSKRCISFFLRSQLRTPRGLKLYDTILLMVYFSINSTPTAR